MTLPTIHLNGTSPERLVEALETAYDKLREAREALAETAPNGRDYYPQGPQALYAAQDEHLARDNKLQQVMAELEQMIGHISNIRSR